MNTPVKIVALAFLLTTATFAGAGELGRLFFTPEQRARMDHDVARAAHPDTFNGRTLSLTGIVQEHGGPRTVWINGVPQPAGRSDDRSPESASVTIPGQKKKVRVKVGQKVYVTPPQPQP